MHKLISTSPTRLSWRPNILTKENVFMVQMHRLENFSSSDFRRMGSLLVTTAPLFNRLVNKEQLRVDHLMKRE
jgi:UDP-N-acetylglucosamine 2-epimerase